MAYNKVTTYGDSENIVESEKGLITKTRQANASMATADVDRKVIKAGTLYTNPDDATDIGIFFEDTDMTDYASKPVSVVVAGRIKKDKVAAAVTAKADDFKTQGLYLV